MKRTIEIAASFSGKISVGQYENENPFFSIKEIMELEQESFDDEYIKNRQRQLHDICYKQFQQQAEIASVEKIAKQYQNIRFYDAGQDRKYPSVTSIIGWDADFHVTPDELAQYAARGTIIHKQVELFLKTGEWKQPKEIPEIYPELVILKQGNLALSYEDVDFQAFYKEYPFKVVELEKTVFNHDLRYAGRMDIKCVIESVNKGKWEKIDGVIFDVPTILDVKTGSVDKTQAMKQQTAYAKSEPDVQQIGVIPLSKENKCGYSKPVIETNLDKYWTLFVRDRENFKKRFGV